MELDFTEEHLDFIESCIDYNKMKLLEYSNDRRKDRNELINRCADILDVISDYHESKARAEKYHREQPKSIHIGERGQYKSLTEAIEGEEGNNVQFIIRPDHKKIGCDHVFEKRLDPRKFSDYYQICTKCGYIPLEVEDEY